MLQTLDAFTTTTYARTGSSSSMRLARATPAATAFFLVTFPFFLAADLGVDFLGGLAGMRAPWLVCVAACCGLRGGP